MSEKKDLTAQQQVKSDAEEGSDYCYRRVRIWGPIYYVGRSMLILFSALTSAQALGAIAGLKEMQGVFALLVTLLAAFDAWLKPSAKYRALFQANDEYTELSQKVTATAGDDIKAIHALQDEYRQINARLRQVITP
jgi:hypothetical protein